MRLLKMSVLESQPKPGINFITEILTTYVRTYVSAIDVLVGWSLVLETTTRHLVLETYTFNHSPNCCLDRVRTRNGAEVPVSSGYALWHRKIDA